VALEALDAQGAVADDAATLRASADALADNDLCVHWRFQGLQPNTRYRYRISHADTVVVDQPSCFFQTAIADEQPGRVRLAFGSCADTKPLRLWTQMIDQGAEGIVLLGDTPYIDSTDLAVARQKHRDFLSIPELAAAALHTPIWGTWDDHDFGKNGTDGRLPGKKNTRRAFVEYRANASDGHDGHGIYTKFRRGPVEVFLLDTRWFSGTEPSPVDADKPTLLGQVQWDWLCEGLKDSTAPFKVIACGMIWDDKKNKESDDWDSYSHERSALFDFLGKEGISGVVLIGGDIHCSRLLRYKTEQQVGYAMHQFIVSPIHHRTIPSLNVDHPDLVRGEAIPHVWLRLDVDTTKSPATLHAQWVQMAGQKMWDIRLTESDLRKS
jgi:alkaline phosphatase D